MILKSRVDPRRRRRRVALRPWLRAVVLLGASLAVVGAGFVAGVVVQRRQGLSDLNWLAQPVRRNPRSPKAWATAATSTAGLPHLTLDLKFKDYLKLLDKRNEALRIGILQSTDDDFVPARLAVEAKSMKAQVRLKGDWTDHLQGDRWSYRVELAGDGEFLGMRRFSLQTPITRNHGNEPAFYLHLRHEGILTPRYGFCHLTVNGRAMGVYAYEEHFAKELLESQGCREGVILKIDETRPWAAKANGDWTVWGEASRTLTPFTPDTEPIDAFGSGRLDRDPVLAQERARAILLLRGWWDGGLSAGQVFDPELWPRFFAICDLWSAEHALHWNNLRFYYNPVTQRLQPVAFDAELPNQALLELTSLNRDEREFYCIANRLLEDRLFAAAYLRELRRLSDPAYLEQLHQLYSDPLLTPPWSGLGEKARYLAGVLHVPDGVRTFVLVDPLVGEPGRTLRYRVEIKNVVRVPVEVYGVEVPDKDGQPQRREPLWAGTDGGGGRGSRLIAPGEVAYAELSLAAPAPKEGAKKAPLPPQLTILSRVPGIDVECRTVPPLPAPTLVDLAGRPAAPSIDELLRHHPCLVRTGDREVAIRPGDWRVAGDLVLPDGVTCRAEPGTTLRFGEHNLLLAGGPLVFRGTAEQPIGLLPQGTTWAGVAVLEAGGPSLWEHVTVRNTHGVDRSGWYLTGGVTFYRSAVTLDGCILLGSTAEDTINVVHSLVEFDGCELGECVSDAFDGDFVAALVNQSAFHDVRGDCVDVSGSRLEVTGLRALRIGDKVLSIGEASEATATDVHGDQCGIGAAAKDGSTLHLTDSSFRNCHFGLAAYIKKPVYAAPSLFAERVELSEVQQTALAQTGCIVKVDGVTAETREVDVEQLYQEHVLGN